MKIELKITKQIENKLITENLNFTNIKKLEIELQTIVDSNVSCFSEIYLNDELKITFVYADKIAHLGIWKNCEECFYIYDKLNVKSDDFVDIGWNSFLAVNTTNNTSQVIEAIGLFLEKEILSEKFEWISDEQM